MVFSFNYFAISNIVNNKAECGWTFECVSGLEKSAKYNEKMNKKYSVFY